MEKLEEIAHWLEMGRSVHRAALVRAAAAELSRLTAENASLKNAVASYSELNRQQLGRLLLLTAENKAMREALEWYGEKASSLASIDRKDWATKGNYIEAIFIELSLDAGRRAAKAIAEKDARAAAMMKVVEAAIPAANVIEDQFGGPEDTCACDRCNFLRAVNALTLLDTKPQEPCP